MSKGKGGGGKLKSIFQRSRLIPPLLFQLLGMLRGGISAEPCKLSHDVRGVNLCLCTRYKAQMKLILALIDSQPVDSLNMN